MVALAGLLAAARKAGWDHGRCYEPDHEWRHGEARVRLLSMYNPLRGEYWRLTVTDPAPVLTARIATVADVLTLLDYAGINPVFAAVREGAHR